jgi:exodeoxyribonuclease V beta subunit
VRGAVAGNFLHEQLEWLAGEGFALSTQPALAERLRRRCERSPYAPQADDVVAWLTALVQTPLPHLNARLDGITTCLPEMAFWLPVDHLSAHTIDTLCQQHLLPGMPRPPLPKRQLHGMLMGFADLVFEHGGRYWVLDHKSNHLGPDGTAYTAEALAHAMAHHRYDVQAALYLLALHRLLAVRLGEGYDPSQHLGGAVYLFLRGIDGPTQGVYWVPPNLPLLTTLDAALPAGAGGDAF